MICTEQTIGYRSVQSTKKERKCKIKKDKKLLHPVLAQDNIDNVASEIELHSKTGTYGTMTTTCNSCANSLNQFCKTISTIMCFRHRFQLLTALSSKHNTQLSALDTIRNCEPHFLQHTKHHPLYFAHFINAKTSLCSDGTHCYSSGKTSISKAVVQCEIKALAI